MTTRITCETRILQRITLTTRSVDGRLFHTTRSLSSKTTLKKGKNSDGK